jgi:glycosyltransferase involved in cell wall biosynthesis
MKLWIFTSIRNEAGIIPFFARHYSAFAERIIVFDDKSTDATRDILKNFPRVQVRDLSVEGLHEDELLTFAHEAIKEARSHADYVAWPDADELLYAPSILNTLQWNKSMGHQAVRTLGFNMMGAPLPEDDGQQLTQIYRTGVRAPVYSKTIIVDPSAPIQWTRGKHFLEREDGISISPWYDEYRPNSNWIKLLHYRYLTPDYTRSRNARQFDRSVNKHSAWSCNPNHKGEHSPEWVEETMKFARDVVCDEGCYLPKGRDA